MKAPYIILGLGITLVIIGTVEGYGMARKNVDSNKLVYNMCQQARENDSVKESTCGDLQDHFNVEYLCKQNNKLASDTCWVEAK